MNKDELKAFMGWFKWVIVGILALLIVFLIVFSILQYKKKRINPTKFITVTGVFGTLATLLYVLVPDFGLGFTPFWLKVHLDEIPIFLVGFMYGPLSSIMVTLVKTAIKLPFTTTAGVGELGDFVFTLVFTIPALLIYERKRKLSSVFKGLGISTACHVIFAMIANVYIMVPFYSFLFGAPIEQLQQACSQIMPFIEGDNWLWLYALCMVLPMNLIKDAIVIVVVLLIYKRLHIFIQRIGNQTDKTKSA